MSVGELSTPKPPLLPEWLTELALDGEVLGSIPAPSKLFSRETAVLKKLFGVNAIRKKNGR